MNDVKRIGRRLKLRDLNILMTVVRCGTMGKAAAQLAVSQPVISKAIADLEHTVGVRLLDRSKRGVEPTLYGRALIRRGVAIFDEMQQSLSDIEFLSDPSTGEVRIGATPTTATAIVLPIIQKLTGEHRQMRFHVSEGDTTQLIEALGARSTDLVITRIARPLAEEFHPETLFHDELAVVTGARNPLLRQRRIALADLVDEPWVFPTDNFFGDLVAASFRASGFEGRRPTVATGSSVIRDRLLSTRNFLTVTPGFLLFLPSRRSDLKALPVKLPNTRHPVFHRHFEKPIAQPSGAIVH